VITRLARWWLRRHEPPQEWKCLPHPLSVVEECEVCGEPADHRIVSGGDDAALGIVNGGTLMAADFCAAHCPGGCLAGCAKIAE